MSNSTKYKIIVTVTQCCFIIMLSLTGHIIDGSLTINSVIFRCIFVQTSAEDAHRCCRYIGFPFVCQLKSVELLDSNDYTFHYPNVSNKTEI